MSTSDSVIFTITGWLSEQAEPGRRMPKIQEFSGAAGREGPKIHAGPRLGACAGAESVKKPGAMENGPDRTSCYKEE